MSVSTSDTYSRFIFIREFWDKFTLVFPRSQCPNYLPYLTNVRFVSPSDPYIFHPLHAVYSQLRGCDCSFSIHLVENRQHISGGGKLRPPNSSLTHSGLSSEVRFPGRVIFTSRLSFIRLIISGFTVGNCGELTHGHARAVIGVDIGVKFSGRFFIDTFEPPLFINRGGPSSEVHSPAGSYSLHDCPSFG